MIVAIDHVNIRSSDYQRAKDLFVNVLGLEVGWRPSIATGEGAWLYRGDQAIVHLSAAPEPTHPSKGSVIDHIAFEVEDYDEAKRRLEATGVEYRPNDLPERGVRQLVVMVPGGATLELYWRDKTQA